MSPIAPRNALKTSILSLIKMISVSERYETPEVTTVEVLNEGVLCGSVPAGGIEGPGVDDGDI